LRIAVRSDFASTWEATEKRPSPEQRGHRKSGLNNKTRHQGRASSSAWSSRSSCVESTAHAPASSHQSVGHEDRAATGQIHRDRRRSSEAGRHPIRPLAGRFYLRREPRHARRSLNQRISSGHCDRARKPQRLSRGGERETHVPGASVSADLTTSHDCAPPTDFHHCATRARIVDFDSPLRHPRTLFQCVPLRTLQLYP
jgi:hypothetical protein